MANKSNTKKKMSPLTAGAIGAGIGALAGAAAVALTDEKTRKKIGQGIKNMEKKMQEVTTDAEKKAKVLVADAKKSLKGKIK